jgi:branched-subunit amino acid transport protein
MPLFLTILLMGAVTYAQRLSLIGALGKLEMPAIVIRALRFVPPAVLTAIIVPEVLYAGGETLDFSLGNARLIAAVLATLIAWRSKNVVLTVVVGMAALWLIQWLR